MSTIDDLRLVATSRGGLLEPLGDVRPGTIEGAQIERGPDEHDHPPRCRAVSSDDPGSGHELVQRPAAAGPKRPRDGLI